MPSFFSFLQDDDLNKLQQEQSAIRKQGGLAPEGKVKKAHADIQGAYGESLKVLKELPFVDPAHDPEGQAMNPTSDYNDLKAIEDKILRRGQKDVPDNPLQLADDLRVIASRSTVPPEYAKLLHGAADKLTRAYAAQGDLSEMQKPGQPLAVNPEEVAGRKETLAKQIKEREEQLKTAGSLRTPTISKELDALRAEEGRVNLVQNNEIGPQNPPDLNSVLTAFGTDRAKSLQKLGAVLNQIGMVQNMPIHPGAFGFALTSMMAAMGDAGIALMDGTARSGTPKPTNAPPKAPPTRKPGEVPAQQDPYQAKIEARQNDVMNAVSEIKNLKTFDSTWKVGLYILFSLIMGPAPAAMLFTNKARRGELKFELDALERDLSILLKRQQQERQFKDTARHHAVMEDQGQQRIDQDVYMDDEYLKLRRASAKGKDPEYDEALKGYRLQKDELDEIQDVLNNQFDYSESEIKSANKKLPEARARVAKVRGYLMTILNRNSEERQKTTQPQVKQ